MTDSTEYRFGVSEFTTWPWPFERDIKRYAANGIDTIEITEFKLDRNDYAPQLESIVKSGLGVSSVQSTVHSLFPDSLAPQPAAWEDRLRHMQSAIERIAPHVPPGTPFVAITGAAPGGNTQHVCDTAVTAFRTLAEHAAKHGVRLAFEPLNPVLFNTDTALWGLDDGLALVRAVDHQAFGLCVDTWNIWQTPNLDEVIRAAADRIFVVQVSDWRRPRSGADRVSIGDGTLDNAGMVRAIRGAGYTGPYVLEIFSGESLPSSIWRSDLDVVLQKNRDAFAHVWKESRA